MVHRGSKNKMVRCHWTALYLLFVSRVGFPQHPDYVIAYYAGWPRKSGMGEKAWWCRRICTRVSGNVTMFACDAFLNWKLQEMPGEWHDVWESRGHPGVVISVPSVPVCGRHRIVDVCIVDIEASTDVHYCGVKFNSHRIHRCSVTA